MPRLYISMRAGKSEAYQQKRELFHRIAELLGESPGIRPQDGFVDVIDAARENRSVGTVCSLNKVNRRADLPCLGDKRAALEAWRQRLDGIRVGTATGADVVMQRHSAA